MTGKGAMMGSEQEMIAGFRAFIKLCLMSAEDPGRMAQRLTDELLKILKEVRDAAKEAQSH
jgi:hypothetical protein